MRLAPDIQRRTVQLAVAPCQCLDIAVIAATDHAGHGGARCATALDDMPLAVVEAAVAQFEMAEPVRGMRVDTGIEAFVGAAISMLVHNMTTGTCRSMAK